jgi:hypothetical protein
MDGNLVLLLFVKVIHSGLHNSANQNLRLFSVVDESLIDVVLIPSCL